MRHPPIQLDGAGDRRDVFRYLADKIPLAGNDWKFQRRVTSRLSPLPVPATRRGARTRFGHLLLFRPYGMLASMQAQTQIIVAPIKMVLSRTIDAPAISMSGDFYADTRTGAMLGWLVTT